MILDFCKDTTVRFDLDTKSSGHYLLPLTKKRSQLVATDKLTVKKIR